MYDSFGRTKVRAERGGRHQHLAICLDRQLQQLHRMLLRVVLHRLPGQADHLKEISCRAPDL